MRGICELDTLDKLCFAWRENAGQARGAAGRREAVRGMARVLVGLDNLVVMDTETTGLSSEDEVVEVAVVSGAGDALVHTLVKPTRPIPAEATAIHGISDADVRAAPMMDKVAPVVARALRGKFAAVYNSAFDFRLLNQSLARARMPAIRHRSRAMDQEPRGNGC